MKQMTEKKYDLAVAYRIYPRVSKSPPVCRDDKYTLADICLRSFKESLGILRARIWVILDDCPPKYKNLFTRYFDLHDLVFVSFPGSGNAATSKAQIECLLEQNDAPYVYLAEDDYFYLPKQFEQMLRFLNAEPEAHFISPYDHPDYYSLGLHDHPVRSIVCDKKYWRQSSTTCFTFLTTRAILRKTAPMFYTLSRRNYDNNIWMSLNKYPLLKPSILFRTLFGSGHLWKSVIKAWFFGWRQICFGTRWKLWTPVPTIATHMEKSGLAPGVDWPPILKEAIVHVNDPLNRKG